MSSDTLQQFSDRLREAGLVVDRIEADGFLHRCGVSGKEQGTDGAYKAFLDAPASLWWKNWRTGDEGTWCGVPNADMTAAEREALKARIEAWQFIFLLVASTAVCRALQAEKAFLLLVASQEEPTPEMLQLPSIGAGWCTALARLADKTGAPLIEQSNAVFPGFVEETLVDHPAGTIEDSMQFNCLSEMWNTHCKYCSKNDGGRQVSLD